MSATPSPITAPADAPHAGPPDEWTDARQTAIVLATKWRQANNGVRFIKGHLYLHLAIGLGVLGFLLSMGMGLFTWLFKYLMSQEVFGPALMDHLVGLVLLVFFSLLTFSNLIVILSTTYLSKEVEFLMALPASRQAVFRLKLAESIFYSSWAFAVLSMPLFASYGLARDAVWYYYPLVLLLVVPFLTIPATLGALVTMVLAAHFPARKTRTLCIVLGVVSMLSSLAMGRMMGVGRLLSGANEQKFDQILSALSVGSAPFLPSSWLGAAIGALAPPDPADVNLGEYIYWLGMMTATALFLLEVTRWLVPSLYYRGWSLSRETASERGDVSKVRTPRFGRVETWLAWLRPNDRALLAKDLRIFWRDPAQWTQVLILVGLMAIYLFNLRGAARYSRAVAFIMAEWKTILTFFNLAAVCFILSILTTRFVYPLLSLEGRGFWTVGLAPISRSRVVMQKYFLCLVPSLLICHALSSISSHVLALSGSALLMSHGTVTVMALGLTSLSVGIGALLPNFKEDNPARIANGLGGTANIILSLIYIAVSVASLVFPLALVPESLRLSAWWNDWGLAYVVGCVTFQVAVIYLPMRFGIARWNAHEF